MSRRTGKLRQALARFARWTWTATKKAVVVLAFAYPVLLFSAVLLFRFVGEESWLLSIALYLPRVVFLVPVVPIAAGLFYLRRRRLLWTQLVAVLLVLFPLMGLEVRNPLAAQSDTGTFRVMTINANLGYYGFDKVTEAVFAESPDVFLAQESKPWSDFEARLKARYPHTHQSGQFVLASRGRILEATEPEKIPFGGRDRSPRFMRYVVETNLGPIAIYNMHPISPRGALGVYRFRDALRGLKTGMKFADEAADSVGSYTGLRAAQIRAAAELARRDPYPAVMAGDFNLPGLSRVLHEELGDFEDGFAEAGSGFGYTFPSRFTFLRLDRIFARGPIAFQSFAVGCRGVSDHLCVFADLGRAEAPR